MAEEIKDGGPAFPFEYEVPNIPEFDPERPNAMYPMTKSKVVCPGMTLRDYFAAKALGGIATVDILKSAMTEEECELVLVNAAELSYRLADAMLAARENGNG